MISYPESRGPRPENTSRKVREGGSPHARPEKFCDLLAFGRKRGVRPILGLETALGPMILPSDILEMPN